MPDEKAQHYVTARIGEADRQRIERVRQAEDRSRSAVVRKAIKLGLDLMESRAKGGK